MNKLIKPLKSFTIMELIVAMILTSLVVSIAAMGLRLITSQFNLFKESSATSIAYMNLASAMQHDFNHSRSILLDTDGISCTSENTTIHYTFPDSLIVRTWNEAVADTFRFHCSTTGFWFENQVQDSVGGFIDKVSLKLIREKDTLFLSQTKLYDAKTLLTTPKKIEYGWN